MATITNISLSANLNCNFNLKNLCNKLYNCIFDNKYFVRIIFKLREPKQTFFIYQSGKIICVGAESVAKGRKGIRRLARIIQKLGYNIKLNNICVNNIAATYDTKTQVDLTDFYNFLNNNCVSFDRHRFPNLRIKYEGNKRIVFSSSGKLVLTGLQNIVEVNDLLDQFVEKLFDYKLSQQ
jgi:transcription initiation factor TFIID TATA-box-binding protein